MKPILTILALLVAIVAQAPAQAAVVRVNPVADPVTLGDDVIVEIAISALDGPDPRSLAVFDIDVAYDTAILAFAGAAYGTGLDVLSLGSIRDTTPSPGSINFLEISLDDAASLDELQPGSFTLLTLTFHTVAAGQSALGLDINVLGDPAGASIAFQAIDGSVQVSAVPEPSVVLALLSGLLLIGSAMHGTRTTRSMPA